MLNEGIAENISLNGNNNISFDLIATTVSTNATTFSTDLTKYDALVLINSANNSSTAPYPVVSSFVPMPLFKISTTGIQARWVDSGNYLYSLARYVSDTSITLMTNSASNRAWLYGVYMG